MESSSSRTRGSALSPAGRPRAVKGGHRCQHSSSRCRRWRRASRSPGLLGVRGTRLGWVLSDATAPKRLRSSETRRAFDVDVRSYQRIVSVSTICRRSLDRHRRAQPTSCRHAVHARAPATRPWRYEGKAGIATSKDLEAILALEPDIVFVNGFTDLRHLARMRDAGLTVFNLGAMFGVKTLLPNIEQIATVVGARVSGVDCWPTTSSGGSPTSRRALPLETRGASRDLRRHLRRPPLRQHDRHERARRVDGCRYHRRGSEGRVLGVAGVLERAAPFARPALDPHQPGRARMALCALPRPRCAPRMRRASRFGGVDAELMSDPGLGILRAAEAVYEVMYAGSRVRRAARSHDAWALREVLRTRRGACTPRGFPATRRCAARVG